MSLVTLVGTNTITIRPAQKTDLDAVNKIVESCVMDWDLPERVKRLSLSSYRYHQHDLKHFEMIIAVLPRNEVVGVAAWEPATHSDLPINQQGMLLHGLYIDPQHQKQGIGSYLIDAALSAVSRQGMNGLLVKAQVDAIGFYQSRQFIALPVEDSVRDYPHRLWRSV